MAMKFSPSGRLLLHLLFIAVACGAITRARQLEAERDSAAGAARNGGARQRKNLVLAPVGDQSQHESSWLDNKESRTWDLVLFYYGRDPEFACADCLAVVRTTGAKWRLVWELSQTDLWKELSSRYDFVMVPDDDLLMSTHVINTAFALAARHGLLLSQPSVCRHANSFTWVESAYQQPGNLLRYTAMVEIMAPVFEMRMFTSVALPTLEDAWTAWGLDVVWPVLLGFPRDKIGVVDAVCATHPAVQPHKVSLYKEASDNPYGGDARAEYDHQLKKYNITNHTMAEHGLPESLGSAKPFSVLPMPKGGVDAALGLLPGEGGSRGRSGRVAREAPAALGPPLLSGGAAWLVGLPLACLALARGWTSIQRSAMLGEMKRRGSAGSLLRHSPGSPSSLQHTSPRLLPRQNSITKQSMSASVSSERVQ